MIQDGTGDGPPVSSRFRAGDVVAGKYRIDRVLGAGGMGMVLEAFHLQLQQRVAIKLLLPQAGAAPDTLARFAREAQAAARIQSEHVARVIDVAALDDGSPYMVMEFLEGTSRRCGTVHSGRGRFRPVGGCDARPCVGQCADDRAGGVASQAAAGKAPRASCGLRSGFAEAGSTVCSRAGLVALMPRRGVPRRRWRDALPPRVPLTSR